jgi:hypothetical protein
MDDTITEKLKGLASKVRLLIAEHSDCRKNEHKLEAKRRHLLANDYAQPIHFTNAPAPHVVVYLEQSKCAARVKEIDKELANLLSELTVIVAGIAGSEELLTILHDDSESALIRCEMAAEFINAK